MYIKVIENKKPEVEDRFPKLMKMSNYTKTLPSGEIASVIAMFFNPTSGVVIQGTEDYVEGFVEFSMNSYEEFDGKVVLSSKEIPEEAPLKKYRKNYANAKPLAKRIQELHQKGMGVSAISRQLGVSKPSVYKYRKGNLND